MGWEENKWKGREERKGKGGRGKRKSRSKANDKNSRSFARLWWPRPRGYQTCLSFDDTRFWQQLNSILPFRFWSLILFYFFFHALVLSHNACYSLLPSPLVPH
jgi:hypothetical protein